MALNEYEIKPLPYSPTKYFWISQKHLSERRQEAMKTRHLCQRLCTDGYSVRSYTFFASSMEGGEEYLIKYPDAILCCIGHIRSIGGHKFRRFRPPSNSWMLR